MEEDKEKERNEVSRKARGQKGKIRILTPQQNARRHTGSGSI